MSSLLKTLNEQRGAKLKKAQSITEKASEEKRGFSDEERNELRGLQSEVEKLDEDLDIEVRNIAQLSRKGPDLSEKEKRDVARFNLGKIVRHLSNRQSGSPDQLDGIEAEMHQEGAREAREAGLSVSGVAIPRMLMLPREQRATLSVTGGTTTQYGGDLVETEVGGVLGDFYNNSVMEQNGAVVLTGLMNNLSLPNYEKGSAPAKKAENAAAGDVGGSFTTLELSPNRLSGYAVITDQLLMQSDENVARIVGGEINSHMRQVKEVAFFHGAGTNEPVGIAATSGIGSVVGGTNGAAPDWADIVDLETAVLVDDVDPEALRYFTNSAVRGKLKKTVVVSGTSADMIWDRRTPGAPLNDRPASITNAVSSALTKGSSSGVCSAIFFGAPRYFYVGYWGGVMLEVTRDSTDAKAGQRHLVANTYYDAGLRKPEAFSAMLDALTA